MGRKIKALWPYSRETCERAAEWARKKKLSWHGLSADERRMIVDSMVGEGMTGGVPWHLEETQTKP